MLAAQLIFGAGFPSLVVAAQAPPNAQIPILPPHVPIPGQGSLTGNHKFVSTYTL
jgi:hypothetical protein